jgi:hypothetical protein
VDIKEIIFTAIIFVHSQNHVNLLELRTPIESLNIHTQILNNVMKRMNEPTDKEYPPANASSVNDTARGYNKPRMRSIQQRKN